MNPQARQALGQTLIGWADDELVLGHRDSEWTGHAPILEEDIAFANIALDEIGHAGIWYRLAAELLEEDPEAFPDRMIYRRPAGAFRSIRLVELPRGDWAFTIVRQYLFDAAEDLRWKAVASSRHPRLAQAAAKVAVEERYHLRHSSAWVTRLGRGTAESNRRMQSAVEGLWPFVGQLFHDPAPEDLEGQGILPSFDDLKREWESRVRPFLADGGLRPPAGPLEPGSGRGEHTPDLGPLVDELQAVARLEGEVQW